MSLDTYLDWVFERLGGGWVDALVADDMMEQHGVIDSEVWEAFYEVLGDARAETVLAERRDK